MAAEKVALAGG